MKKKFRDCKTSYARSGQDDGLEMFFVIFKMVRPDTHAGCLDIKKNI